MKLKLFSKTVLVLIIVIIAFILIRSGMWYNREVDDTLFIEKTSQKQTSSAGGITFEEDSKISPISPQSLVLTPLSKDSVKLEWFNGDVFVVRSNIYVKKNNQWAKIGQVEINDKERYSFVYQLNPENFPYIFSVTAVDVYGNESQHSETVVLSESE